MFKYDIKHIERKQYTTPLYSNKNYMYEEKRDNEGNGHNDK